MEYSIGRTSRGFWDKIDSQAGKSYILEQEVILFSF